MVTALSCQIKIETRFKTSNHISSRQSSNERIQSVGNYTTQQDFRWVPWVYMYNNTIDSVAMLASNMHDMRSQLYTQLKLKSTELLRRANLFKKHA